MKEDNVIQVLNLSKKFPIKGVLHNEATGKSEHMLYALKDVSFTLDRGQSVGIIGPNGSGKSTLLKILAGITKPSTGQAMIRGRVASILDIGAGFHPYLSGKENIFLNGQLLGFSKKEIERHYDYIVSFSGVESFLLEPVKNYSSGMYLRLAFSIMACLDFDVYLLDEVMGVGDAEFQKQSSGRLKDLIASGKTCLFASHNFLELKQIFNTFLYIEKGKLEVLGTNEVAERLGMHNVFQLYFQPTKQSELFQIESVKILAENQTGKIKRSESFEIFFKYRGKSDFDSLEFAFRFKKDNVPFAFFSIKGDPGDNDENDIASFLSKSIRIPSNFLNAGIYTVDLFVGTAESAYVAEYNCLCFQIVLDPSELIFFAEPIVIRQGK